MRCKQPQYAPFPSVAQTFIRVIHYLPLLISINLNHCIKGKIYMALKRKSEYDNGPIPLDESWWTAVLEDIEALYSHKSKPNSDQPDESHTPSNKETVPQKEGALSDEINWNWAKQLYEQDLVVSLDVADHNRGGLLVLGDEIQGFVPASHLVGLSNKALKKNRDDLLSPYVGRSIKLKVIECDQERGRIVFSERAAQTEAGCTQPGPDLE